MFLKMYEGNFFNKHRWGLFLIFVFLLFWGVLIWQHSYFASLFTTLEGFPSQIYTVFPFLLLFGGYFLIWWKGGIPSLRYILLGYLIFSVVLILVPPLFSTDVYIYAMRGRVFSEHGANPYLQPAEEFKRDRFLYITDPAWRKLPQNYGPLWTLASSLLTELGGENIYLTIVYFKLLTFAGNSLVLYLIYLFFKDKGDRKLTKGLYLYAWNPLILLSYVSNGCNGVWMLFFGLLAVWFLKTKKEKWILPALMLAGLIKYIFLALAVPFLVRLYKKKRFRWKEQFFGGFIALFLGILFFFPFLEQGVLEGLLIQANNFDYFPPFLYNLFPFIGLMLKRPGLFLWIARVIFLVFYVWLIVSFKRPFHTKSGKVLVGLALLVPATIVPWYLIWSIPFWILGRENGAFIFLLTGIGLFSFSFIYSVSFLILLFLPTLVLLLIYKKNIFFSEYANRG